MEQKIINGHLVRFGWNRIFHDMIPVLYVVYGDNKCTSFLTMDGLSRFLISEFGSDVI